MSDDFILEDYEDDDYCGMTCPMCNGDGLTIEGIDCPDCDGSGEIEL